MGQQVFKGIRLPLAVVNRIDRVVRDEGSTFSQFARTAIIQALNRKKTAA